MKKFLLLAATLICGTAFAQNMTDDALTASVASVSGDNVTIEVGIDNATLTVRDFQFDLYLSEGVTLKGAKLVKGRMPYDDFAEAFEHGIARSAQGDGAERFVVNNTSGHAITGTSGAVMQILVNAPGGKGTAEFKNIVLSAEEGTYFPNKDVVTVSFTETGISSVNTEVQNAAAYDLQGRRVQKAENGVFIINGKKVLK